MNITFEIIPPFCSMRGYALSTEYKTFIKFGGALVQTNARVTFSYRFVIKIRAIVCPSIRLPNVYFEGYKLVEGQRFSKIMQITRILALGAALTLCALATGSLGFKVYTHLSEVRKIDANLGDRHLHKLSLDYERLHFTYFQNSNGPLLDGIQSDIIETINKVQSHNVIQNKILQAQVTLLLDEVSQTLARLPSGDARQSETILSTTLDAVVVVDERGLIRKYNASAERIFGYRA